MSRPYEQDLQHMLPFSDLLKDALDTDEGRRMPLSQLPLALALSGLFFVSGFAALLYQVTWQRMLVLLSGSDVRSVTIVVSAYLAGLGVGSLAGAFYVDRVTSRRAVQLYALFNLAIAGFAFASPFIFYDVLFQRLSALGIPPAILLAVALISLLWPTTLMGLSLPLMSRALVRNIAGAAGMISLLNGLNTLGAAMGAIIGGWVLVGTLGFDCTAYIGGMLSVLVGLLALWIVYRLNDKTVNNPPAWSNPPRISLRNVPGIVWLWCLLVLSSGFVAISLEIVWFRVLDVSLRSNAYTYSYLLFWFLICDGLGSIWGARLVRRLANPRPFFLAAQAVITLYALLSIAAVSWLARFEPLARYIAITSLSTSVASRDPQTIIVYILLPMCIIAPPAVLIGLTFPLMQRAVQTDPRFVGQRVGLLQTANIVGNTAAGILTGLVMLQYLGTDGSLRLLGGLGLLFGALLLLDIARCAPPLPNSNKPEPNRRSICKFLPNARESRRLGPKAAGAALVLALLLALILFPDKATLWGRLHGAEPGSLFLVAEDSSGVTALREFPNESILYANGRHQGRIPFQSMHVFLGVLPALVHPNPQDVLVIGLGSGGTPYSIGVNERTRHIIVIEIMGSQLPVVKEYADTNNVLPLIAMFGDPRYEIMTGDGRRFLGYTDQRFDLIEADAILPVSSGSGFLYSREYFEQARARLKAGGIVAQWRPTGRVETTFVRVFPYVINIGNVLLLGSDSPIHFDMDTLLEQLEDQAVSDYLTLSGTDANTVRTFLAMWPVVATWEPGSLRGGDINTDLRPRDEYYLNNPMR